MVRRTLHQLKRAKIVIPQLSPTLSKARIYKWLKDPSSIVAKTSYIECYEPLFVLQCSPDLLSSGYQKHQNHKPLMLIEAHDEGMLQISEEVLQSSASGKWFPVGHFLGTIDDDDDDDDAAEWLWQAYSYEEDDDMRMETMKSPRLDNTAYYAPLGVIELKGLLRNRGLDISGSTREVLVERLLESDNGPRS